MNNQAFFCYVSFIIPQSPILYKVVNPLSRRAGLSFSLSSFLPLRGFKAWHFVQQGVSLRVSRRSWKAEKSETLRERIFLKAWLKKIKPFYYVYIICVTPMGSLYFCSLIYKLVTPTESYYISISKKINLANNSVSAEEIII